MPAGAIMARGPKKQRLNIFLMKEGVGVADVLQQDIGGLTQSPIRPGLAFDGLIVARECQQTHRHGRPLCNQEPLNR